MGRWDFLEGVTPVTAADAIVTGMARVIADELSRWPPRLDFTDEASSRKFAPLYAPGAPPASEPAVREGFRLARWELAHELAAIDDHLRNDGVARAARTPHERLAVELLWKLLPELLYELAERTENRLTRRHLIATLDLAEKRLYPSQLPLH